MDLKEQISQDYMVAFKTNDPVAKVLLNVLKGEIQNESTKKAGATPLEVVLRMEKSLKQINTPEALKELEVLKKYLPSPLTEEEIRKNISSYIFELDLLKVGDIMKQFNSEYKGRADSKLVIEIATEMLKNL